MSSSRLPGKVLKPILDRPMLALQVERVQRASRLDQVVVVTSTDNSDDAIAAWAESAGVDCCRGSLDDVLDRFATALEQFPADHVVRLTADCPLIDPRVIDEIVALHLLSSADYTSNCLQYTLPDGLDVEVLKAEVLSLAAQEATSSEEREHVTPFVRSRPGRFVLRNWCYHEDLSGLRWTVDYPQDFEFVASVYRILYPDNPKFCTEDVLALLQCHPELAEVNAHIPSNLNDSAPDNVM